MNIRNVISRTLALCITVWALTSAVLAEKGASPSLVEPTRVEVLVEPSSKTLALLDSPSNSGLSLALTPLGPLRQLPKRILGASVEPLIEPLLGDHRKLEAVKETAPAILRFPGGSQSNYYDWRTGLLSFAPQPDSSAYYKFWTAVAPKIARAFPNGITYEQYATFADQLDAETILVPNIETSSVEEQVAWFKRLASAGVLPRNIELGNEFYIAMGGDPAVMRKWPDEQTSMAVLRSYEKALRPIVGPGAKFAVQSAASSFVVRPNPRFPMARRMLKWDYDLHPADWFEAVTAHLYPLPDNIAARAGYPGPDRLFELFMGRADQGVDRVLDDIARRLPGKEIWITEWSPRGGKSWAKKYPEEEKVTPAMAAHLVARETLAILRHLAVTKSLYFMLNLSRNPKWQAYVQDERGQFLPLPVTVVLGWFNHAANGGCSFQRFVEVNGRRITGLGVFDEAYRPIEAGLFTSGKRTVLILQNASPNGRVYDPTGQGRYPVPTRMEILTVSDFTSYEHRSGKVIRADTSKLLELPPFSIARIMWEADVAL